MNKASFNLNFEFWILNFERIERKARTPKAVLETFASTSYPHLHLAHLPALLIVNLQYSNHTYTPLT